MQIEGLLFVFLLPLLLLSLYKSDRDLMMVESGSTGGLLHVFASLLSWLRYYPKAGGFNV